MLIPPWLLLIRTHGWTLPIPLIVFWPLLFFAALCAYLVLPLALLLALPFGAARLVLLLPSRLLDFVCSFRGLSVDLLPARDKRITVQFR